MTLHLFRPLYRSELSFGCLVVKSTKGHCYDYCHQETGLTALRLKPHYGYCD